MERFARLAVLALRPLLDAAGQAVGVGQLVAMGSRPALDHLTDHSTRIEAALETATERAWNAVEVALAGEGLLEPRHPRKVAFGRVQQGGRKGSTSTRIQPRATTTHSKSRNGLAIRSRLG